ncbi:hypothetical protein HDV00_002213 [Rhizophlyctis rosea]|nr:hypothetical protein HDV00_002213 [Rhizophlyctis rosea]
MGWSTHLAVFALCASTIAPCNAEGTLPTGHLVARQANSTTADLPIYVKGASQLSSGYANWSWGTTANFAFAGPPTPSYGGPVISATVTQQYGGVSVKGPLFGNYVTWAFDISGDGLSWMYSVGSSADGKTANGVFLSTACPYVSATNFTTCYVDLTSFGSYTWDRLNLQSASAASNTLYLANSYLSATPATQLRAALAANSGSSSGGSSTTTPAAAATTTTAAAATTTTTPPVVATTTTTPPVVATTTTTPAVIATTTTTPAVVATTTTTTTAPLPTINPCPNPPSKGTIQLSGMTLLNADTSLFGQSGTAQARFSAVTQNCTYSKVTVQWSIDSQRPADADKFTSSLAYSIQLLNFTAGVTHGVSASATYFGLDGKALSVVNATSNFTVQQLPLEADLATEDKTVPTTLDLLIDASDSYDNADPCYVASFVNSDFLKKCLTANSVSTYNSTRTPMTFTFGCQNFPSGGACNFTAKSMSNLNYWTYENTLYINTTTPYLTIPAGALVPGTFSFRVAVSRDSRAASPSEPRIITVINSKTYVVIQRMSLIGASVDDTFIGSAKIGVKGDVYTNSQSPVYNWTLSTVAGAAVAINDTSKFVQNKDTFTIAGGALASGRYIASLNLKDENNNTATGVYYFGVIAALPAPSSCTISPTTGTELTTSFTATCAGTLSLGSYYYSYDNGNKEVGLVFPGGTSATFPLSAGNATNQYQGTVRVRSYIPGTNFFSAPFNLTVTVNVMTLNTSTIGATFSSILTAGSGDGGATLSASVQSFTSKLSGLSDDVKTAAVAQVITAVLGTVNATTETTDSASSKTLAISSLVTSSNVTDDTKQAAASSLYNLATVLSSGASTDTITAAVSAYVAVTPSTKSAASADQATKVLVLLAQGLSANLVAGQQTAVVSGGTTLSVAAATPDNIPAQIGGSATVSGSASLRKRATASTGCSVVTGAGLQAALASYGSNANVVLQSTCMANNPYPISAEQASAGSHTLAPYLVTLGVSVNSQSVSPSNLSSPITVVVPTIYTASTSLHRRDTTNTTTTYAAECVMWDNSTSTWSSNGCVTSNNATDTSSVTCQCNGVGSYSVIVVKTTSNSTTGAGSGAMGSAKMSGLSVLVAVLAGVMMLF